MKYTTEMIHDAFSFIKARKLGFEPKEDLMELALQDDVFVTLRWLEEPTIEVKGAILPLDEALEEFLRTDSKNANMVMDILDGWFDQFCTLCYEKVKGGWAANSDALHVIKYAIKHAEEFNVYVPMFDINFTNEDGEDDDTKLWEPVAAFGNYIDIAASCYEILELARGKGYTTNLDDRAIGFSEASADIDREFTEDERANSFEKLKKVKEELTRQKNRANELSEMLNKEKMEARAAARAVMEKVAENKPNRKRRSKDIPAPEGVKFDEDFDQLMKKPATRKLRECLRVLRKNKLIDHVLDVDGWVVRLHLSPVRVMGTRSYDILMPWVGKSLTKDEFDIYVKAKNDKKCPVAWEYLYIIDNFLQNL